MASADQPIDLWVLPLLPRPGDLELLSTRERARADRLQVAGKRDQLVSAQADLRRVLATYLGSPASRVELAYGDHGKPFVAGRPDLGFNLSHSGGLAAIAVCDGAELGIDIEDRARSRPFLRLARRYFAAPEAEWLESQVEARQADEFYRTWTLKEAYLKAIGTGLKFAPGRFSLHLERRPAELAHTEFPDDPPDRRWSFAEPKLDGHYAAAICYDGEPRTLRRRSAAELDGGI